MDDWNEIKTAATVARLKTISAASKALGVHRITVTRRIDALENALGAKLFQRHARGFTVTELGEQLLRIANATENQFGELTRMAHGSQMQIEGELVVTCLDVLLPYILQHLVRFQSQHPQLKLKLLSSDHKFKLEYGEADLAFRIGPPPEHPDNVVMEIGSINVALQATQSYANRYGLPKSINEFADHRFVGVETSAPRTPYVDWLDENVSQDLIIFRTNSISAMWKAVEAGLGIGFYPLNEFDENDLSKIQLKQLDSQICRELIWAVTHMDLHRSGKVQALVKTIKQVG